MATQKPKPKRSKAIAAARPAAVGLLAGYASLDDWLDRYAGPFFPTRGSLEWFIKQHRPELVELGALVPREGRAGSLVQVQKFSDAVASIHHRRASERLHQ